MRRFWISLFFLAQAFSLCAQQPVDYLYTARYVVTIDPQRRVIENGAVAIRNDRIVAVGGTADLAKQYHAYKRLDHPNSVIMPGLINTHTHAPMSLLRGIADDLKLQ